MSTRVCEKPYSEASQRRGRGREELGLVMKLPGRLAVQKWESAYYG